MYLELRISVELSNQVSRHLIIMKRNRVRLIHWKPAEVLDRVENLRSAGYEVAHEALSPSSFQEMRENPPDAVVIDLSRIPSQGRDVGLGIRKYKDTRHVPLD